MRPLLYLLLASTALFGAALAKRDKIRLKDVEALTFRQNEVTTSKRSRSIPQLQCIGGSSHCEFSPKVVQCYNRGFDGNDVQWECKSDLKNKYSFGKVFVNCEGYEYTNDEYILVGSCGLEYELDYTVGRYEKKHSYSDIEFTKRSSNSFGLGFIAFAVCAIALIYFCLPSNGSQSRPEPTAPPPPGFNPSFFGGNNQSGFSSSNCGREQYSRSQSSTSNNLWSGVIGAGLGYMLGRNSNTSYPYSRERSSYTNFTNGETSGSDNSESVRTASGFASTKRR